MKLRKYTIQAIVPPADTDEAELAVSRAVLSSLKSRELLTAGQERECRELLEKTLRNAKSKGKGGTP